MKHKQDRYSEKLKSYDFNKAGDFFRKFEVAVLELNEKSKIEIAKNQETINFFNSIFVEENYEFFRAIDFYRHQKKLEEIHENILFHLTEIYKWDNFERTLWEVIGITRRLHVVIRKQEKMLNQKAISTV